MEHENRKARTPYKRSNHNTLVRLVKYLLQNHKLQFVLLGKFQIDNLEVLFGMYRMLSGSNLVSVNEVI